MAEAYALSEQILLHDPRNAMISEYREVLRSYIDQSMFQVFEKPKHYYMKKTLVLSAQKTNYCVLKIHVCLHSERFK